MTTTLWDAVRIKAVFEAAERWDVQAVKLALDDGFPVDAVDMWRHDTLLHCVAGLSRPRMQALVPRMLAAGWDPNAVNKFGCTPLHCACEAGYVDTVRAMVHAGGALTAMDNSGWTVLDYASRSWHAAVWQVLEWLATCSEVDWCRKPRHFEHALQAIEGMPECESIKARSRAVIVGAMAAQRRWSLLRAAFVGAAAAVAVAANHLA